MRVSPIRVSPAGILSQIPDWENFLLQRVDRRACCRQLSLTKTDAQSNKLATVVGRIKLTVFQPTIDASLSVRASTNFVIVRAGMLATAEICFAR